MKNKQVVNSLIIIQVIISKIMTVGDEKRVGGFQLFAKQAIKYYTVGGSGVLVNLGILYALTAVSYTHLTLPTIYSV